MLLLPPPLAAVIHASRAVLAGQAAPDEVRAALPAAYWFVWNGSRLLDQLSPGLLRTGRVTELLGSARQEAEAQWRALQALESAVAEERNLVAQRAIDDLASATERLQDLLRILQAEEAECDCFSPYPEFDHFLKTGRNLLDGHVGPQALQANLPGAASLAGRLRAAAKRFSALYDNSDLVCRVEPSLERLEMGLGAAAEFLAAGQRTALEDCLRLLGPASVEVHQVMADMDAFARQARSHALHPLVEELVRARQRTLPEEDLRRLWDELTVALEEEAGRVEVLRDHPLRLLAGLEAETPTLLLERARMVVEQARAAGLATADLAALDAALWALREALAERGELLERALAPVQGAPFLAELQMALGRATQGQLSSLDLQAALDHFRSLQDGLAGELLQSAGLLEPEEEEALHHLLGRQVEAAERLEAWCQDGDVQNLCEGWQILAETTPRLVETSLSMRQRLQASAAPASGSVCVRCGVANAPGARYCGSCSAVLPVVTHGPTEYADILGGAEPLPAAPAHVVRLEELVRRVEEGLAGPDEVASEVDDLLGRAEQVAQGFQRQVLPRVQQDPAILEYANFFREQMGVYVEGLHCMRRFSEEGRSDLLYRGLESCRSAGSELTALRAALDQAAHS